MKGYYIIHVLLVLVILIDVTNAGKAEIAAVVVGGVSLVQIVTFVFAIVGFGRGGVHKGSSASKMESVFGTSGTTGGFISKGQSVGSSGMGSFSSSVIASLGALAGYKIFRRMKR